MEATCEICEQPVPHAGEHWCVSNDRPDGYWGCHKQLDRCRCAKCDHVWRPRQIRISARCPACGETGDLFWADDGGWEQAAREKKTLGRRGPEFDFKDDEL